MKNFHSLVFLLLAFTAVPFAVAFTPHFDHEKDLFEKTIDFAVVDYDYCFDNHDYSSILYNVSPLPAEVWQYPAGFNSDSNSGLCTNGFNRVLLCHGQLTLYGYNSNSTRKSYCENIQGQYPDAFKTQLQGYNDNYPSKMSTAEYFRQKLVSGYSDRSYTVSRRYSHRHINHYTA